MHTDKEGEIILFYMICSFFFLQNKNYFTFEIFQCHVFLEEE